MHPLSLLLTLATAAIAAPAAPAPTTPECAPLAIWLAPDNAYPSIRSVLTVADNGTLIAIAPSARLTASKWYLSDGKVLLEDGIGALMVENNVLKLGTVQSALGGFATREAKTSKGGFLTSDGSNISLTSDALGGLDFGEGEEIRFWKMLLGNAQATLGFL